MAAISSLQIGGTNYDIYATSSKSAYAITNTAIKVASATSATSALSATSSTKAEKDSSGNVITATYGVKTHDVYYVKAGYNTTTYPNYDSTKTYATGAYVVTGNRAYSASAAVTVAGAWSSNSSKFTTASTTVAWTGNTTATSDVTALYEGLKISLKIPSLSGGATTQLNLNGLGAKTILRNTGNYTTHLPANSIAYLTYDGTYWKWADYDSTWYPNVTQNATTENSALPIILKRTTGGNETNTVKYATAFTYNPSTSSLIVKNISGVNITATTFSGNLSGTAKSAEAAPFIAHDHGYKLSGNGTAVNVSAGINFKPSGSNIKFYVSGNDIYISAKNDNSTAFIPSSHKINVSSNGTNVGTVNLSGMALSAGSNVTLGIATNTITITAKDTKHLSAMVDSATYFSGTTASPSALSALTAKTALSSNYAKSAKHTFGVLASATSTTVTAANTALSSLDNPKIILSNSGENQKGYIIWSDYNAANAWSGNASAYFGNVAISDGFVLTSDQVNSITLTKNLSATNFKADKISATNLSGTNLNGTSISNIVGSAQSGYKALTALSGLSGIKTFKTINANTTALNASSSADSWTLKVTGVMSMSADTATNTITLSSRDNNSTGYLPSATTISGINGTTTGVYYLSALKLNAGTNIGFTSASTTQLTITAKDTLNTVGATTSTAKMYLVGTTATGNNPSSNVHTSVYASGGDIYANNFIGSAKTAIYASGAGSATKAVNDSYGTTINASSYLPKSWSGATASLFSGKASSAVCALSGNWIQKTDNQEYKAAFSLNKEFNYNNAYTYNPSLQRLTVPSAVKIGGCTLQWNASTSALDFNF